MLFRSTSSYFSNLGAFRPTDTGRRGSLYFCFEGVAVFPRTSALTFSPPTPKKVGENVDPGAKLKEALEIKKRDCQPVDGGRVGHD